MRLHSRLGASSVQHEQFGCFDVDADGVVDVPEPLGHILHSTHIGGQQAWETDAELAARLAAEDLARRKDPATLLAALEALTAKVATQQPPARKPARARRATP